MIKKFCINAVDSTSNVSMMNINMTTKEARQIEKIANESIRYAKKAIAKSNEVYTLLSLMEAKAGKGRSFKSVDEYFKRLKLKAN